MSEIGYEVVEEILNVIDFYDLREQWVFYIINVIKVKELFFKDVNYIVWGQDVMIVDEFIGRVMQVLFVQIYIEFYFFYYCWCVICLVVF